MGGGGVERLYACTTLLGGKVIEKGGALDNAAGDGQGTS